MVLKGTNLVKTYQNTTILHDLSLELKSGESLAVTGKSGIGKSTLMSVMGLLLEPDEGIISLDGTPLNHLADQEKARIRNTEFGYLFQNTQLIGSLTVLENVLLTSVIAGKKMKKEETFHLLEKIGLKDRMHYYPHQLSIGQKRRASLARGILMNPSFLFADEPTNDLDEENASIVSDLLFSKVKEGTALFLITHDPSLAGRADSILKLQ